MIVVTVVCVCVGAFFISYFFLPKLSSMFINQSQKITSKVCISSKLYCKHNKNKITYITKKQLNTFLLNYFCFIIFHKQDDNFLSLALVLVGVEGVAGVSEGVVERARLPDGWVRTRARRRPTSDCPDHLPRTSPQS